MEKKQVTCFEMQKTCLQLVRSPRDQGTMSAMESHCYSFKIPKKKKHCLPEVPRSPVPLQYHQDGFQSRKQGCVNQMHTSLFKALWIISP